LVLSQKVMHNEDIGDLVLYLHVKMLPVKIN